MGKPNSQLIPQFSSHAHLRVASLSRSGIPFSLYSSPLETNLMRILLRPILNPINLIPTLRSPPKPLLINLHRTSTSLSNSNRALMVGESIGERLWMKFKKDSTFSLYTPFVICLASGTLNLDTFRHYISQDLHFLKAFAQAYELAEECADDDDAKVSISRLKASVLEELKMHGSFIQEWGADLVKENIFNSATVKYTDFLLATSSGKIEGLKVPGKLATPFERTKIAAYTLGAMTPCMRLYAFIGKELQALLESGETNHPYKKWIQSYSSDGFQALAQLTEDVLESSSASLTGEELDIIEKLYHQAMKLEVEFFCAQPLEQPTIVPLLKEHNPVEDKLVIFSDFDLTCTSVDSCAVLGELAIVTAPNSLQSPSQNQTNRMLSADVKSTWGSLSKQYTKENEQCIEHILSSEKAERFDYEGLHKALEQLSEFEKQANTRVLDSGVLKGLNLEDIKRAGERLALQDGCKDFFCSIMDKENINVSMHLLSFCWCADLIRAGFTAVGSLAELNVHANEFAYENSTSTGELVKRIETPIDKAHTYGDILKNCSADKKKVTVYIGDSVGDLLCLLLADVGIVIGSSSSLRKVGTHFGVSFVPLFPGLVKKQNEFAKDGSSSWKGLSGTLYTVSTWAEIHAFILGS